MSLHANTMIYSPELMLILPSRSISCHFPVYSRSHHADMPTAYSMGFSLYLWPLFVIGSLYFFYLSVLHFNHNFTEELLTYTKQPTSCVSGMNFTGSLLL